MRNFTTGPFLSASLFTHTFSYGLYHDYLLSQAIDVSLEHEKKIQEAIDGNEDINYIEELRKESEFYESIFNISLAASAPYDEA
tara:strand:+ start:328 stop:579 length:252 start_codon:yes stop_codon:yes gene_type:complete